MEYLITYSNYLILEGRVLSFRKKHLFDITSTPKIIELKKLNLETYNKNLDYL